MLLPPTQEEAGNRLHGTGASLSEELSAPSPLVLVPEQLGRGLARNTGCRGCVLRWEPRSAQRGLSALGFWFSHSTPFHPIPNNPILISPDTFVFPACLLPTPFSLSPFLSPPNPPLSYPIPLLIRTGCFLQVLVVFLSKWRRQENFICL